MNFVNEKRTEEEFGYKISDLKINSAKPIYRICEICEKEEIKKAQAVLKFKQTKCLKCSNKINANTNSEIRSEKVKEKWRKEGHPRSGVKHTEESKKKMSDSTKGHIKSEETRKKLSESHSGEKNAFYGKKHSEENLIKMRAAAKKNARHGKDCNLYGKTFYAKYTEYLTVSGEKIKLKSSWELKTAEYLDSKNINWKYEEKSYPVSYIFEGKEYEGTYTPDFFLENGEVWEVKGYWRKDALVKFETFKQTYPDVKIVLLNKEKLKELNIL